MRGQRQLDQPPAFVDLFAVPQRPILLLEQQQLAIARLARRPTRVVQQHQREQAGRLGLREQLDEQAAEPNRLGAQVVTRERRA